MIQQGTLGLALGSIALGLVHGVEPGHGWPIAASYAIDKANKWLYGFAASFVLGVGHLVSSLVMVGAFFYAKSYFQLTQVNQPIVLAPGVRIGGPIDLVAGVLLILLGIREYTHGHSHGSGGHDHDHSSDHDHSHDHGRAHAHDSDHQHGHHHRDEHHYDHDSDGPLARIARFVPLVGGHSHSHGDADEAANRGLLGIAWFAFLLGFAHEEEFEIIGLCAGSNACLLLMGAYATAVIVGIVGLTMLLIAGYHHFEAEVERYTPYLPAFSAAVLVVMGVGFVTNLF